jgi:hypothetical protein
MRSTVRLPAPLRLTERTSGRSKRDPHRSAVATPPEAAPLADDQRPAFDPQVDKIERRRASLGLSKGRTAGRQRHRIRRFYPDAVEAGHGEAARQGRRSGGRGKKTKGKEADHAATLPAHG